MPALKSIRKSFDQNLASAELLFKLAETFSKERPDEPEPPIRKGQAKRIAALAFLVMVKAWEELVEACLVRYLMGANAPFGQVFDLDNQVRRVRRVEDAYGSKVLKGLGGLGGHLKVTNWDDVSCTANKIFRGGRPFTQLTPHQRMFLQRATAIRNRVAHDSKKYRDAFLDVAGQHGDGKGQRRGGYTVGDLLLKQTAVGFGDYACEQAVFTHYAQQVRAMADVICPVPDRWYRDVTRD